MFLSLITAVHVVCVSVNLFDFDFIITFVQRLCSNSVKVVKILSDEHALKAIRALAEVLELC